MSCCTKHDDVNIICEGGYLATYLSILYVCVIIGGITIMQKSFSAKKEESSAFT